MTVGETHAGLHHKVMCHPESAAALCRSELEAKGGSLSNLPHSAILSSSSGRILALVEQGQCTMSGDHTGMVAFAGLSHPFAKAYAWPLTLTRVYFLDHSFVPINFFFSHILPCRASLSFVSFPLSSHLAEQHPFQPTWLDTRSFFRLIVHRYMTSVLLLQVRSFISLFLPTLIPLCGMQQPCIPASTGQRCASRNTI
jgi:hypothetical protein